MPDHVHMLLSIPPKYAVSQVVGYIKGKSAIHLARVYGERKRGFVGQTDLRQFRPECGAQIVDMIDTGVAISRKRGAT